jgi:tRNA U54 and U55 pseudouridine synthase Pus10
MQILCHFSFVFVNFVPLERLFLVRYYSFPPAAREHYKCRANKQRTPSIFVVISARPFPCRLHYFQLFGVGSLRKYVRTIVQTPIFSRKNTNYASIFDFLRLNLANLNNL